LVELVELLELEELVRFRATDTLAAVIFATIGAI
jgi:hypothetical protein